MASDLDLGAAREKLIRLARKWQRDPLAFAQNAFPWGEGTLAGMKGPDEWQTRVLAAVRDQIQAGKSFSEVFRLAVASGNGIGKALDVDLIVDTPSGPRRWGDLRAGDYLYGPDGEPTRIVAIPYRGIRPCYRVSFDDGSSTIASGEHLWTVRGWASRRRGGGFETVTTEELLRRGLRRKAGSSIARTWELPRITIPRGIRLAYAEKKQFRVRPVVQDRYLTRFVDAIEPVGERECMCVTVDRSDGLFLANDFIVTHNSCLVAWLCLWAICTMADTRGVVTANTETQLRTKTFAELAKWYNLCVFRPWFDMSATSITSKQPGHEKTWRIDAVPWSESNPEAVAGMHNKGKRLLIIFDEASGIADSIWEAIEGAQTDEDTQILWLCFGNPTRNTGRFYDCFGRYRHRWIHWHIDSRTAVASNKAQIAQWVEDYGEDSDFVKVHVRGVFPSSSAMQFIPRALVDEAQKGPLPHVDYTRMVAIIGLDVARFGDDQSVITTRFGLDARSIAVQKFRGLDGWDLGAKVAEHYNALKKMGVRKVLINVDAGGVGASPIDWLRRNGYPVTAVNFGAAATDRAKYKNLRAEMWGRMREWLSAGGRIADDEDLASELTSVEYGYTPTSQILLEKKEDLKARGLPSPDAADSLALTFAVKVNEYLDDVLPSPSPTRRGGVRRTRDPYCQ